MRDRRLKVFEEAVDGLVESLDATVRLARWTGNEPKPQPLVASAGKLIERLGAASRLATARFQGPPTDVAKVTAMCAALKRLDDAHVAYRQRSESTRPDPDALVSLEAEVAATAATSTGWK